VLIHYLGQIRYVIPKLVAMKLFLYIFTVVMLIFMSTGCTLDNEEEYFSSSPCDTVNVTYQTVRSIFINNCAECHNFSSTYREGIELDTYQSTVSSINTGLVIPAIKHTGPYRMPNGQPQLPDCLIKQIDFWIENGLPETAEDI
jgi:hypothetical protein